MPPKKKTETPEVAEPVTAQEAAALEVEGETDQDAAFVVPWRGHDFRVPQKAFASAQFQMGWRAGSLVDMLFAVIGPQQSPKFLERLTFGEELPDVTTEFFKALDAAAGTGNS